MGQPLEHDHQFEEVGWYATSEAQRLIAKLEQTDIRYQIDFSTNRIANQSASEARFGGTFGSGAQVLVVIWSEDREQFHRIHRELFKA